MTNRVHLHNENIWIRSKFWLRRPASPQINKPVPSLRPVTHSLWRCGPAVPLPFINTRSSYVLAIHASNLLKIQRFYRFAEKLLIDLLRFRSAGPTEWSVCSHRWPLSPQWTHEHYLEIKIIKKMISVIFQEDVPLELRLISDSVSPQPNN